MSKPYWYFPNGCIRFTRYQSGSEHYFHTFYFCSIFWLSFFVKKKSEIVLFYKILRPTTFLSHFMLVSVRLFAFLFLTLGCDYLRYCSLSSCSLSLGCNRLLILFLTFMFFIFEIHLHVYS